MFYQPSIHTLSMEAVTTRQNGPRLLTRQHGVLADGTIVLVGDFRAIDVGVFRQLFLRHLLFLWDIGKDRIGDDDLTRSRTTQQAEDLARQVVLGSASEEIEEWMGR